VIQTPVLETYVIRIYRRDPCDGNHVDGVLEIVERGVSYGFHGQEELWKLLAPNEVTGARGDAPRDPVTDSKPPGA